MATQLASQHQPVRVIRGAGSTPPIARPGPGSQGRQPRPARRPGKALPQHPAIGIQMRTTQPPATQRRPERPGLARNHTTIPTARSSHGAWPGWRVAHPIRSDQAAVPGHTHGSPARQIKPIWMQSPASGTQQLGMQNGYTRLAPVLGPITDGEEEHPSSGASSPNICASPRAGAIVAWSTDQPVRGGPQRRAEPSGTYRGWFVWLARDHERSGSQRGAQRGHGNRLPAVLMDDPHNGAVAAGAALGSNRQGVLCSRQPRRPPAASRPTPPMVPMNMAWRTGGG